MLEAPPKLYPLLCERSPNNELDPSVVISTDSIIDSGYPPASNPIAVGEKSADCAAGCPAELDPCVNLEAVRSIKSVPLPVLAIVINST